MRIGLLEFQEELLGWEDLQATVTRYALAPWLIAFKVLRTAEVLAHYSENPNVVYFPVVPPVFEFAEVKHRHHFELFDHRGWMRGTVGLGTEAQLLKSN